MAEQDELDRLSKAEAAAYAAFQRQEPGSMSLWMEASGRFRKALANLYRTGKLRVVGEGWRDIASAPTDRRNFLVIGYREDLNYWTDPWSVFRDADGGFARWPHDFPPTHWMPIMAPPTQAVTAGGEHEG